MEHIKVIDNFLTEEDENALELVFGGENFPWYYNTGVTFDSGDDTPDDSVCGLSNTVFYAPRVKKGLYENMPDKDKRFMGLMSPVIMSALKEYDSSIDSPEKIKSLYRIRAGMFLKNQNDGKKHKFHVDYHFLHHTMLYYVNDSDGPTVLIDADGKLIQECHPKKGRALIFPGYIQHCSADPINSSRRIVVTCNFILNN